jgi:hypothetical protein
MEESGIATIVIGSGIFRDRLEAMNLPRTLMTHFPMGRPLGAPNNISTQRKVLLAAIDLLDSANHGGTVIDFHDRYSPRLTNS